MYKSKTAIKSYFVFSMSIVLLCFTGNIVQAAPFECFAVSDLVRIFEDGYNCPKPQESLEIFGIRNEYVSAQCVIKANEDLQNVTVSLGPIKHISLSTSLPANALGWNFVGSIPIEENTPKYRKTDLIRAAPARFPDYLAEDSEVFVKKGNYKAVYLTIKIPHNAEAQRYGRFLSEGTPINFSVPRQPGTVISGLRLEDRVLVRRTDFRETNEPVEITVDNGMIKVAVPQGCQIISLR